MTNSDRIPAALRVVRPAAKLDNSQNDSPWSASPESQSFTPRTHPQNPIERIQELLSLGLSQEEINAHVRDYLDGLDEDSLALVKAVLSTVKDGEDVRGLDARVVWRRIML